MTLHRYQKFAVKFIEEHPRCALFLDMGLGKTAITLKAIDSLVNDFFDIKKVLVVAPLRVAKYTWAEEIAKWTPNLTYSIIVGTEAQRQKALARMATIYIINRENLVWLYQNYKVKFDMLVIDELSSFKSSKALRFKALNKQHFDRVVGLTGTPAPNGLMDLWSQFKLIDGGERLGRFIGRYRTEYFEPGFTKGHIVYSYVPKAGSQQVIEDKIKDITVSMKAVNHLDMPKLVNNVIKVTMDNKQQYDNFKNELVLSTKGKVIDASTAAVLSQKLLQMANGAVYCDDGSFVEIHEAKLDALEEIIEAMNGKPLLVAYWFKHDAERIKKRFSQAQDLDVTKWNSGKQPLALIHPASAGHGLNLQAGGNVMVWFSLTWSLELYQQACARLYRQGQKEQQVIIHHIVARGTIDERVMKALESKAFTQDEVIDAVCQELKQQKS